MPISNLPFGYSDILNSAASQLVRMPDGTYKPFPQMGGPTSLNDIYGGIIPSQQQAQAPRMSPGGTMPSWSSFTDFLDLNGMDSGYQPPQTRVASSFPGRPGLPGSLPAAPWASSFLPRPGMPGSMPAAPQQAIPGPNGYTVANKDQSRLSASAPLAFMPEGATVTPPAVAAIDAAVPPLPRPDPRGYAPPLNITVNGGTPAPAPVPQQRGNYRPSANAGDSYTVKKGDTLWAISQRTGIPVNTLAQNSGIKDANRISIGQRINLTPPVAPIPMPMPSFRMPSTLAPTSGTPVFAKTDPWGGSSLSRAAPQPGVVTGGYRPVSRSGTSQPSGAKPFWQLVQEGLA